MFITQPWNKINPPASSFDYVQDICDNDSLSADASQPVQKNNWLHLDTDLFSKHYDKFIGFGFLLAIK